MIHRRHGNRIRGWRAWNWNSSVEIVILHFCYLYLGMLSYLVIQVYADLETFQLLGHEHALLISNHRSDIDWLVGWVLAQQFRCLGSSLAIMKNSSKFLPVIGWSMWFSEYIFLERAWAKDENRIKTGLEKLKDFPNPFWLALFVEGTRFTKAKLAAAQEYATSQHLYIPKNVLIPRTKGFVSSVNIMRLFVPAIYDVTVTIPKDQKAPTMISIFQGQSSTVHIHIKRHHMTELPHTNDGIAQWCRDLFVAKDALLDQHLSHNIFIAETYKTINRSVKALLVMVSWVCLLSFLMYEFFKWASLLSTWEGIALLALALLALGVVMQILIQFSQSERSDITKSSSSSEPINEKLQNTLSGPLLCISSI